MDNENIKVNETEQVSETVTYSKSFSLDGVKEGSIINIGKGDCMTCPYKTNTTSGHCATYAIYGWCRQTMGENPPDIQVPKSFNSEALKWVDSTPNPSYPIRLLRAYLDYTETKTNPPELGNLMNKLQHSRNLLLEKAIDILSRHLEELSATIEAPFYKSLPDLEALDQINQIRDFLNRIEKRLRTTLD